MRAYIISERGNLTIHEPGEGGLLVSTCLERQFEHVRQVMAHGSQKHDTIEPTDVQFDHLKEHFEKCDFGEAETESGLSHRAHAAARALLMFYALLKELD